MFFFFLVFKNIILCLRFRFSCFVSWFWFSLFLLMYDVSWFWFSLFLLMYDTIYVWYAYFLMPGMHIGSLQHTSYELSW